MRIRRALYRSTVRPRTAADSELRLLGTAEAAERLGVSTNRVRQLIATRQLPAVKIGRNFVLKVEDVEAFLRQPPGRPRHPRRALDS